MLIAISYNPSQMWRFMLFFNLKRALPSVVLTKEGPIAQLVERVIRIDEASGSNPLGSTRYDFPKILSRGFAPSAGPRPALRDAAKSHGAENSESILW